MSKNEIVSDCVYYTREAACNNGCLSYWCEDNPACYYKQWQKEKQKNEKLKNTLKKIKEIAKDRNLYCKNCNKETITCENCGYIKILEKTKEVENERQV